jgi:hypothetical protein
MLMIASVVFHVEQLRLPVSEVGMFPRGTSVRGYCGFRRSLKHLQVAMFHVEPFIPPLPCCDSLQRSLRQIVPRGTYQPRVFNQWPITKGDLFTIRIVWSVPPKTFHVERTSPDFTPRFI